MVILKAIAGILLAVLNVVETIPPLPVPSYAKPRPPAHCAMPTIQQTIRAALFTNNSSNAVAILRAPNMPVYSLLNNSSFL